MRLNDHLTTFMRASMVTSVVAICALITPAFAQSSHLQLYPRNLQCSVTTAGAITITWSPASAELPLNYTVREMTPGDGPEQRFTVNSPIFHGTFPVSPDKGHSPRFLVSANFADVSTGTWDSTSILIYVGTDKSGLHLTTVGPNGDLGGGRHVGPKLFCAGSLP